MEEIKLWTVANDDQGHRIATPIQSLSETSTEQWLEELLLSSPDLLFPGLTIVGRQNETETGPLDLLGIDQQGRLILFELKRGVLTRAAVAQALDYASYLSGLSPEGLQEFVKGGLGNNQVPPIDDFVGWYTAKFPGRGGFGELRTVLVGVGVDASAQRMVSFLSASGIDISYINFYAYTEQGRTILARQVESRVKINEIEGRASRASNQLKLDTMLAAMDMQAPFHELTKAFKDTFPSYQWPYPNAYAFSRSGLGTFATFYAEARYPQLTHIYLQKKAVDAATLEAVEGVAKEMGAAATMRTPSQVVHFRVSLTRVGQVESIKKLGKLIADGLANASQDLADDDLQDQHSQEGD